MEIQDAWAHFRYKEWKMGGVRIGQEPKEQISSFIVLSRTKDKSPAYIIKG